MASNPTIGEINAQLQYSSQRKVKFLVDGKPVRFKKISLSDEGVVIVALASVKKRKISPKNDPKSHVGWPADKFESRHYLPYLLGVTDDCPET